MAKSERQSIAIPPEAALWEAWLRVGDTGVARLLKGQNLVVFSPGSWNTEAGPDFMNAEIAIDGKRLVGHVETHRRADDWFAHGHHDDPIYRDVVLHVVGAMTDKAPDLPTLLIEMTGDDRKTPSRKNPVPVPETVRRPAGHCAPTFARYSDEELRGFFRAAGVKRFKEKSARIAERALRTGMENAVEELLFEACGYKKNRPAFLALRARFARHRPSRKDPKERVAAIWGESGLLPEPTDETLRPEMAAFVREIWDTWWKIRVDANAVIPWNRGGARPLNSPCRRVAALTALLTQTDFAPFRHFAALFADRPTSGDFWKILKKALVQNDPLWNAYSDFSNRLPRPAAVLGESRALDIAVNVVLPALHAAAKIHRDAAAEEATLAAWATLPLPQCDIVRNIAAKQWLLPIERAKRVFSDAAGSQGCLHIFRDICAMARTDCQSCRLPDALSGAAAGETAPRDFEKGACQE